MFVVWQLISNMYNKMQQNTEKNIITEFEGTDKKTYNYLLTLTVAARNQ